MAVERLDYGSSDGCAIGGSATDKIALYGATPVAQRSGAAGAAVGTTAATSTTPYGFATSTQANAISTLLNELRATVVGLGAHKGAA